MIKHEIVISSPFNNQIRMLHVHSTQFTTIAFYRLIQEPIAVVFLEAEFLTLFRPNRVSMSPNLEFSRRVVRELTSFRGWHLYTHEPFVVRIPV